MTSFSYFINSFFILSDYIYLFTFQFVATDGTPLTLHFNKERFRAREYLLFWLDRIVDLLDLLWGIATAQGSVRPLSVPSRSNRMSVARIGPRLSGCPSLLFAFSCRHSERCPAGFAEAKDPLRVVTESADRVTRIFLVTENKYL